MSADTFDSERIPDEELERWAKEISSRKPKPIVVVKVIVSSYPDDKKGDVLQELNYILGERMKDYYVFVISQEDFTEHHDSMEFQVFYEKDQQPIYYEELKRIIEGSIKPTT